MGISDKLARKWIYNGVQIERFAAHVQAKLSPIMRRMGQDLIKTLLHGDNLTGFQSRRFKAILKEAKGVIGESYGNMEEIVTKSLSDLYSVQATHATELLDDVLPGLMKPYAVTSEEAAALVSNVMIEGAPSAEWWSRRAEYAMQDFSDNVRMGMVRGETLPEIRDRIMGKQDLRKVRAGSERTVIKAARRGVEALVRTSLHTVAGAAHMAAYEANSDIIKEVQWLATLDTTTCLRCGELDGEKWKLTDHNHPFTPLHWACRCILLPITKSFEELFAEVGEDTGRGRALDALTPGERASMNGQVAESLTYENWLAGESVDVQRDVLGAGRFDLWSKGKLGLSDMLDQRGNPIPLTRLRSKS